MKKEWGTFFLAFVGALAWLPQLYEIVWTRPEIKGKLIHMPSLTDVYIEKYDLKLQKDISYKGLIYCPRIALVALKKDFHFKKIQVKVKYPEDPKIYEGRILYLPEMKANFPDGKIRKLTIPSSEQISLLISLERGKSVSVFVPFIVDKSKYSLFERIEFEFFDYGGRKQSIVVYQKELDALSDVSEEKYWSDFKK